jgi:4-alpha-glucanotransferase
MDQSLRELAALYGVETSYWTGGGEERVAEPEALLRVLRVLGAPVEREGDVPGAVRQRRQEAWQRVLEPVTVAWDGGAPAGPAVVVRWPAGGPAGPLRLSLALESGGLRHWSVGWGDLLLRESADVEGAAYEARLLPLGELLPHGYHRLTLHAGDRTAECLLLSAPEQAPARSPALDKTWGLFVPVYALHSGRSWGAGDFGDLSRLLAWVKQQGGGNVATLPLLAAFLDEPLEYSPYSPASRLFWNEFYLNVEAIPEWQRCPEARTLAASPEFQAGVEALRREPLVDYPRQMALKRRLLERLARLFFADPADRLDAFRRFVAENPHAEDYARFRAVVERRRQSWWSWPAPLRDGTLTADDYDEEARRHHLYVQWLAEEQLRALAAEARQGGTGLYLDFPLGVNPDSYDVWRQRDAFALGMAGGAPPDAFFTKGQNWGFPPLHPERVRQNGHGYLAACVRHHLKLAGVLRIDHVMGLHRLFWIPEGMEPRHGVYVRYPAEELYALLTLEASRRGAVLVGEDLGMVPAEVRPTMARHEVQRTYIVQYELDSEAGDLRPIPPGSVASINTHDMPTFAAFWQALDLEDRQPLGLLNEHTAREEADKRKVLKGHLVNVMRRAGFLAGEEVMPAVLKAILVYLANGADQLVLANLEDLWLETQPQNVPGTWRERPNWRKKVLYPFETWTTMPAVLDVLREMDRVIRQRAPGGASAQPAVDASAGPIGAR